MRTPQLFLLIAALATIPCLAADPAAENMSADQAKTETANNSTPAEPTPPAAADAEIDAVSDAGATNGLRMNFRGAPLNLVLDYLSDAAGFIIDKQAEVRGTVDLWSKHPVSKEEAVELLHSNLRKNGYAVTRNGRILTIVKLDEAKTQDLPVERGSDPDDIDKSEEVIIQTIPVRYANATQLMNNLQVLLPTSATLSANESANTLILVATKTDIRRMLKIIHALDTSIASVSNVKVFPLKFADAKQLATVIQQLFTQQAVPGGGPGGNQRAQMFAMMRGGGPGGPGGGQAPNAPGTGANTAGTRVVASADEYSNSLIVSAAPELLATITDIVDQIDQPISEITELQVFRLVNADPSEIADQLMQLFPDDSRSGTSGNQNNRFQFGGRGGRGGAATASSWTSKKTRVIAIPDQRTSSLIVSASGQLMPQIGEMVAQLDSSPAKKEKVAVFELQNANPQEVYQIMQDLFNRNSTMRNNNANTRGSLLGQNNPLTQRATQQQQQSGSQMNSRFGNNSRTGSGGGF